MVSKRLQKSLSLEENVHSVLNNYDECNEPESTEEDFTEKELNMMVF